MGGLLSGKIAKIVFYDNGGTNYDYPGQHWVSKLVDYISSMIRGYNTTDELANLNCNG